MAGETDAEHIEHFAFQPVRRPVHAGRGRRLGSVGELRLDAHALVAREAVDDVNKVEALGPLRPIHRRDVHQVVEVRFHLQVVEQRHGGVQRTDEKVLPQVSRRFEHTVAEPLLHRAREFALPRRRRPSWPVAWAVRRRVWEAPAWRRRRVVWPAFGSLPPRAEKAPPSPQASARQPLRSPVNLQHLPSRLDGCQIMRTWGVGQLPPRRQYGRRNWCRLGSCSQRSA
jgi:hypothetical protein